MLHRRCAAVACACQRIVFCRPVSLFGRAVRSHRLASVRPGSLVYPHPHPHLQSAIPFVTASHRFRRPSQSKFKARAKSGIGTRAYGSTLWVIRGSGSQRTRQVEVIGCRVGCGRRACADSRTTVERSQRTQEGHGPLPRRSYLPNPFLFRQSHALSPRPLVFTPHPHPSPHCAFLRSVKPHPHPPSCSHTRRIPIPNNL